ncbi:MAG: gamma-glutamylcyclotransferase [Sphingobacteriaceae bacterium]|nr:MAG: gamma-glutamylcyclotransferase [Sphingobacteriaceae bacterium]
MINKLFIYGSLLETDNEFGRYLQKHATFYKPGKLYGKLYDAGEYPAAIYLPQTDYKVHGNIIQLINIEETLKVIDDYEGFGDDQLQPNLFIRKLLTVQTHDEDVKCWVYLYNYPINQLKQIPSGDYLSYKKT